MNVLNQDIKKIHDQAFNVQWPEHADLMITRLPSSVKVKLTDEMIETLAKKTYAALNYNSLVFLSISSLKEDKNRPGRVAEIFSKVGFEYLDKIIWVRDKFIPVQGDKRLNNVYEEVIMLSKGADYHLNRKALAYSLMEAAKIKELEDKSSDENGEDITVCLGNVWTCFTDDKDTLSSDLIKKCLILCDLLPNSLVLDPFAWPGPSAEVVQSMGHSFWGCGYSKKLKRTGGKKDADEIKAETTNASDESVQESK